MVEDNMVEVADRGGIVSPQPEQVAPLGGTVDIARATFARVRGHLKSGLLDCLTVAAAFESAVLLRYLDAATPGLQLAMALPFSLLVGALFAFFAYVMGFHRPLWRYASVAEGLSLVRTLGVSVAIAAILLFAGAHNWLGLWSATTVFNVSASTFITGSVIAFLYLGFAKILPRLMANRESAATAVSQRMLIVGAGEAGAMLATHLSGSSGQGYQLVAFVDDNAAKWGRYLHGRPVLGPISQIGRLVERENIDLIAIAMPSVPATRISEILSLCQQTPARLKIVPGLNQVVGDQPYTIDLREVNLADLLGRDVVPLRLNDTAEMLRGKTVLVTGAAGSIGSELCRQLITYEPKQVLALDNNETGLFDLAESLRGSPGHSILKLCVGDITDATSMTRLFVDEHPDIIYHAAAYKHVPLLEAHPYQAARVNVLGTYMLSRLAREHAVERFVFVSTDKAADPVNILGASKRLGELIVDALARAGQSGSQTSFRAVRFGNVIGSRGSVIPTFSRQIELGGPVTVTDPETTRYFMTIPEACGLVIVASALEDTQGLFLLDMGEPVRIADVAMKMVRMRGLRPGRDIEVTYTGMRPGEKMHEALAAPDEKLLPTEHAKIVRLEQQADMPSLNEIDQWMTEFEEAVRTEDNEHVRQLLMRRSRVAVAAKRSV